MRFVDEYRTPDGIARLSAEIKRLAQDRPTNLGGGQTTHVVAFAAPQETLHVRPIRLDAQ